MLHSLISKLVLKGDPFFLSQHMKRVPRAYFDKRKATAFREMVRYAYQCSKFYKTKFDEKGIDPSKVQRPEDLGDFYTLPQDIIEHAEDFICQRPHIVFESSGTSGRNKRVYYTQQELNNIGRSNAIGLFEIGLSPEDRIVNAFDFCIWIPGMVTQKGLEQSRIFSVAAGKVDPAEVYRRLSTYGINVVMGEPTWLIKLTEIAEQEGGFPLKMLIGGAEAMPQAARSWMTRVWKGAKVRMMYGTVESSGAMAFENDEVCDGYHINENNFYTEIYRPDPEGYGEIVFTTLDRYTMPLIRYRNRDISRLCQELCPCGLSFRKLSRLRGRADEMVVASGGNLYPLMFEDILKEIEGITSDWQVIFKLDGIKEVLEFNLEPVGRKPEQIETDVFNSIRVKYPDLYKNYSIGIFRIDYKYHPARSIRTARKLMRVVDARYNA